MGEREEKVWRGNSPWVGAGRRARLDLMVAEHDRGRRPSYTGDEFGRRGPGDGKASASLKNGRAQLG
jgi:hypothetical protein